MKLFRVVYLLAGLALLAWLIANADIQAVARQVLAFGLAGLAVILAVYALEFLADSASWHVILVEAPLTSVWLRRMVLVRMVGEAFNSITPFGGMGGEPVKVVLLKKYYGIGYRESGASLVIAKTVTLFSLIVFVTGGFYLLFGDPRFPSPYKTVSGVGLLALAIGVTGFFIVQRMRLSSALGAYLSRWRHGRWLARILHHIQDFDARLAGFYARPGRFAGAVALALANWFFGVLGTYWMLHFLGSPVTLLEAWIIEALTQLVRAGTFFIPANIGAQEGALVLACGAVTGNPSAGLATALVRRAREVLWILGGLALGYLYSFRLTADELAAPGLTEAHGVESDHAR